jgi:hypothetical protein
MTKILISFLIFVQVGMFIGCKKSSTEIVPEVKSANLEVSSFAVVAERDDLASAQAQISSISIPSGNSGAGYLYIINLGVAETIGGNATVTSVVFSFYNNGDLFGTYTPDVTSLFASSRINAGTNVTANEKRVAAGADSPYADEIRVEITYTDGKGVTKTATATYNGPQYKDADIVFIDETLTAFYFLGFPFAGGDIENRGSRDAANCTLTLKFYDESSTMVNLMDQDVDVTLLVNGRRYVEGICTYVLSWDVVKYYSWEVQWTKADGTAMTKSGSGTL